MRTLSFVASMLVLASFVACDPKPNEPTTPSGPANPPPRACQMDAKVCPDGSSVGRQGPNCEFAPCPGEKK